MRPGGPPGLLSFRDPPGYARYFRQAGFTIFNDANNHSFDFGAAGQAQTVRALHAAGLAQTGLPGRSPSSGPTGSRSRSWRSRPIAYDANLVDLPAARSLIARARREAEVVVVYMHAGAEGPGADHVTGREEYYLGEDRGNPEAFAHMAIDAGASLVIASGPHVLRGMQFYKGHLIAYSLGNFAGYGNFATAGDLDVSVILHVTLTATGRFEGARIYPIQFTGTGRPYGAEGRSPLSPGWAQRTSARAAPVSWPLVSSRRRTRIVPDMKASEIRDLIRVEPVELDATRRRLSACHDLADLRAMGRRLIRARSSTTLTAGPTRRCRCGPTPGPSGGSGSSRGRW